MISEITETDTKKIILSVAMLVANFKWLTQVDFLPVFVQKNFVILQDFFFTSSVLTWARITYKDAYFIC